MIETVVLLLRVGFAFGASCVMAWTAFGFRSVATPAALLDYLRDPPNASPSQLLSLAMSIVYGTMIAWLAWWDVAAPVLSLTGVLPGDGPAVWVGLVNIGRSLLLIGASVLTLYMQWRQIDVVHRRHYSIWTAPLFPWSRVLRRASIERVSDIQDGSAARWRHKAHNETAARRALARTVLEGDVSAARRMAEVALSKEED